MTKRLDKVFTESKRVPLEEDKKIFIMSDCHRGSGDSYDNFSKNRNIFEAALKHYYNEGFTYVELGDGDDMWEVDNCQDIVNEHIDAFKMLKKFNDAGRLVMIYGNHDTSKNSPEVFKNCFSTYYNPETKQHEYLLNNIRVYESLVLVYKGKEIFLVHGHQADLLNSTFWRLSRFLVRRVWRPLEHIGLKDPTGGARKYHVSNSVEKKLRKWSTENNTILISGHTHRPVFPDVENNLYFNDGSCIHPNGITCIEIENGKITLVKWTTKLNKDNTIYVAREVINGSEDILSFYKK